MQGNVGKVYTLGDVGKICQAALQEVIRIAGLYEPWIKNELVIDSQEPEWTMLFHGGPQPRMRVECSVESSFVPTSLSNLTAIMTNIDAWASVFSDIVQHKDCPPLSDNLFLLYVIHPEMKGMNMVTAELCLPIPFMKTQRFTFLRYHRELGPDVRAIIDIATKYTEPIVSGPVSSSEPLCIRRPSGLIIKKLSENKSRVVWIENLEFYKRSSQDKLFSSVINSKFAFSANHWVTTLVRRLNRNESKYVTRMAAFNSEAVENLKKFSEFMKKLYMEGIKGTPGGSKWDCLNEQGMDVFWKITVHDADPDIVSILTSFRIEEKIEPVYHYLVKKNLKLQWHNLQKSEPDQVIEVVSKDKKNHITVHKKGDGYLLQESSYNEFHSLIVSASITKPSFDAAVLSGRWNDDDDVFLYPSGFTIIPALRPRAPTPRATIVTIFMQVHVDPKAIQSMKNFIVAVAREIQEECYAVSP